MVEWCQKNGFKVWGHTLAGILSLRHGSFRKKNAATGEAAAPTPQPATTPAAAPDPNGPRPGMGGFGDRANTGPQASREVILERLKNHIMTVVGRYKGKITGWDVFNESIADGGDGKTENLRNYSWYQIVGPDVITLAFKWAHEADPNAQLCYNDYNIEQGAVKNTGKHASSILLLKRLIAEGAPIPAWEFRTLAPGH